MKNHSYTLFALVPLAGSAWGQCESQIIPGHELELPSLGQAISASGKWAFVGAQSPFLEDEPSGPVQLLERSSSGVWSADDLLFDQNGDPFRYHGRSIAVDGQVAVIGAPLDDDLGADAGAVFVFELNGGEWAQTAKLYPDDAAGLKKFGTSVAVSGQSIAVGAPGDSHGDTSFFAGAVYVFRPELLGWGQGAKVVASDGEAGDVFGTSVALEGNRAVVGAPGANGSAADSGVLYVVEYVGGSWVEVATLATSGSAFDQLGGAIALSGNTVLAGVPLAQPSGAAIIFERTNGHWAQAGELTQVDGEAGDRFGTSVSLDGDIAVVGASRDDDACPSLSSCNSGSAYLYLRTDGAWGQSAKLTASDGGFDDRFGRAVAVADNTAMIGAPEQGESVGAVYLYSLEVGDRYCEAEPNSTGSAARILVVGCGDPSISADSFVLRAENLPPGEGALFAYSAVQVHEPFGNGFRCIGTPSFRLMVGAAAGGMIEHHFDFDNPPTENGMITAGSTWNFQALFRDMADSGGIQTPYNSTDAIEVTFEP